MPSLLLLFFFPVTCISPIYYFHITSYFGTCFYRWSELTRIFWGHMSNTFCTQYHALHQVKMINVSSNIKYVWDWTKVWLKTDNDHDSSSWCRLKFIDSPKWVKMLVYCYYSNKIPVVNVCTYPVISLIFTETWLGIKLQFDRDFAFLRSFPGSSNGKASAYNAGDLGSIPGLERSAGEENGNPLQYSCLENPRDRGAL